MSNQRTHGKGSIRRKGDGTYAVKYKGWHPRKSGEGWRFGQYWRDTGESTPAAAEQRRAAFIAESRDRAAAQEITSLDQIKRSSGDLTAKAILDFYATEHGRERGITLDVFKEFFIDRLSNPRWSEVAANPHVLFDYVKFLKSRDVKAATVRNQLRMTNAIVQFAADSNQLNKELPALTKLSVKRAFPDGIPPNPYRPWQPWEFDLFVEKLLDQSPLGRTKARNGEDGFCFAQIMRFGWLTGWRRDQIENLRWGSPPGSWVNRSSRDQDHGYLDPAARTIWPQKQKKGQQITLDYSGDRYPALATVIADHLEWWNDPRNFGGGVRTGRVFRRPPAFTKSAGIGDWRKPWQKAEAACREVRPEFGKDDPRCRPGMTFHGLRRTVVTRLLADGLRPKVIAKLTGHTSDEIVSVYDDAPYAELYDALCRTAA